MKREEKETFTYAIEPSIRIKAMKRAKKERSSLSEKIREFVSQYANPPKKAKGTIPLPDDYMSYDKIYAINRNGEKLDITCITKNH